MSGQYDISFVNVHKISNKCTPNQIMLYQVALSLFKIVNENQVPPSTTFVKLMNQVVCTSRQVLFKLHRTNQSKIGMNCSVNKLYHVSKLFVLDKLNWSYPRYKKHMKLQFLHFGNT